MAVLLAASASASAHPIRHDPVEMMSEAPVLVVGQVVQSTYWTAALIVVDVVRGDLALGPLALQIPKSTDTLMFHFEVGEKRLVGLNPDGTLWAPKSADALLEVTGASHIDELAEIATDIRDDDDANDAQAVQAFTDLAEQFVALPSADKRLVMWMLNRNDIDFGLDEGTINTILSDAIGAVNDDELKWLGLVHIGRSDREAEYKQMLVNGLSSGSERIRSVSVSLLASMRGTRAGYDFRFAPDTQQAEIADWNNWLQAQPNP